MAMLWTYCVLSAADAERLPAMDGVATGSTTSCITHGALAALVSEVPPEDFDDAPLREHLNDLEWVERTARAHERVLDKALAQATIVPLRMCTLFREREGVVSMLRDQGAELRANLRVLEGRGEWGLKLFVDREQAVASASEQPADLDGVAYLTRKLRERDARAATEDVISTYAAEAHGRVAALADAAYANPVQRPELHGRDADMVLNGVYLVARERWPQLSQAVESLRADWAGTGATLELTGPWPAYNFVATSEVPVP